MSKLRWLAFAGVAAATAVVGRWALDRDEPEPPFPFREPSRVDHRAHRGDGPYDHMDSLNEPVVRTAVPTNIRELERARRAQRPVDQRRRTLGRTYDEVLNDKPTDRVSAAPAVPRSPTACGSVEPAPRRQALDGPHRIHDNAVYLFENESGFGFMRMLYGTNRRGVVVADEVVDRVELVSLLTEAEPSVYVLDQAPTPARARRAERRPLDEFERRGLDAVRRGENLVWTRDAPTRMFGAIRARSQCLECHAAAKKGDLLGAFTYYLDARVDELGVETRPEE